MNLLDQIKARAKANPQTIVLPESEDERTIKAAEAIIKEGIAKVTLLGNVDTVKTSAASLGVSLDGIGIVDPATTDKMTEYAEKLAEIRKSKGMTADEAKALLLNPLYFGAMMVKLGEADGMVAGAINTTGDVLRPALQIIKTSPGISTVSSCFVMIMPTAEYGQEGVMIFADCAVNPNPNAEQMAEIAYASAQSAKSIANITEPKVGMLSFSTKGSAKHELVSKVQEATKIAKERYADLVVDGEFQADAAIVAKVGASKAPGSEVAGKCNVLVFPDLQAGNIGYKLVQRLAGAEAIGPVLQGIAKPVNDLSRGCSVEDIVNVTAITVCQAQATK
ncbi:phosphate acetyltransferase [Desulfofarcimen acetoxidans DSM 771]|uniref:Phosphate acetyltransferase n=1 Tax=Desulfofarcimen acetoxidans (strain ATCC 49208 / DSM 771 / KCTC 5769 / VKM B-1644 / 5575) TaxID=485916 RepID=C8W574_DESAS|nr:phosphate acetyltransferase [Desulfofarcimen acetoxidans]ACV62056.1 phosphate acetyltransferase [Desulfofarcimen acetoxidans DSM 771]